MWDGVAVTEYSSGCFRQAFIGSKGIRTDIPETYARVGAAHEVRHEAELKLDLSVVSFEREVPIKVPVPGHDDIMYSGRADFIVQHKAVGKVIHETKGTISKNTRLKVIRKGLIKVNQLAQLVSYMITEQTCYGELVAGYYEEDEQGQLVWQEGRTFKVKIDDEGTILVDGLPSGYTVYDQIAHRTESARVIVEEVVGDRPSGWENPYAGPCAWCTFKATCAKFDLGAMSTEEFLDSAKADVQLAELNKKPDPQPNKMKPKKEPKATKPKKERSK